MGLLCCAVLYASVVLVHAGEVEWLGMAGARRPEPRSSEMMRCVVWCAPWGDPHSAMGSTPPAASGSAASSIAFMKRDILVVVVVKVVGVVSFDVVERGPRGRDTTGRSLFRTIPCREEVYLPKIKNQKKERNLCEDSKCEFPQNRGY